jgi:hypothetical protein
VQVVDERLTRWHKDFNIEACHEIDTEEFPPKPAVEKFTTAQVRPSIFSLFFLQHNKYGKLYHNCFLFSIDIQKVRLKGTGNGTCISTGDHLSFAVEGNATFMDL